MNLHTSRRVVLCLVSLLATVAIPAAAQCDLAFQPTEPVATPTGPASAMQVWDPDGAGPAPSVLVVGGRVAVGSRLDSSVVSWDGAQWHAVGSPPIGTCTALGVYSGHLIAAISHSSLSSDIVAFDGTSWRVLGSMNGIASAMTLFNGNLVLGGPFSWISGMVASGVVQWNGSTWSALGVNAGGVGGTVRALAVFSGALYVGGDITHASGVPVGNLAIWNGTAWSAGASFNGTVRALAARITTTGPGSALFVGGTFTTVGGILASGVARLDILNNWAALGAGLPGGCTALFVRGVGLTGLELTAGVQSGAASTYRWSGGAWNPLGTNRPGAPAALSLFGSGYVGVFQVGTQAVRRLDTDGSWVPLSGAGIDGPVHTIHATPSDVVIAGQFVFISGVRMNGIARGRIGAWQPLGTGLANGSVQAIASLGNGDIVVGGSFSSVGGVSANCIARWDGTAWSPLGTGLSATVRALAVLPNGHLIAAGAFLQAGGQSANRVALWNGSSWVALGAGFDEDVNCLAVLTNGEVVAAGLFSTTHHLPLLGRWNGSAWLPFPSYPNGAIFSLAALPNGELLLGGSFQTVGGAASPHIVRWNGASWITVPGFTFALFAGVTVIVPLPNGDALVDAVTAQPNGPRFSRFNGQAVMPLPAPGAMFSDGVVDHAGDVLLVGSFLAAGGVPSGFIARLTSPCAASAPRYGTGCTGSGGANSLNATRLPWVGTTFRAETTGLPATGLALAVFGVATTSIPLDSLLQLGVPGCQLLASLDLLQVVPLRLGTAYSLLTLPTQSSLIGQVLHHQVVAFELDTGSNVTAVTSSNGLRLTIGTL